MPKARCDLAPASLGTRRIRGPDARGAAQEHERKAGRGGDSEARIRQNLQSTLTKKFIALVQEYQEMQTACGAAPGSRPRLQLLCPRRARHGAGAARR